jgi:hypothetical protein
MNNDFERIQTEAAVAKLGYYPNICVEEAKETTNEP